MRLAVVALVLSAAVVTPGCLRDFEDPGRVQMRGIEVAAPSVSSGRVTLEVTTVLDNEGGRSEPVRLDVKAFSTQTGLRVARNTTDVGPIEGDTTEQVVTRVDVPRRDGVRIEVLLLVGGRARRSGEVTVRNVGSLQPNVRTTGLSIQSMDFHVEEVGSGNDTGRVRIEARVYVTNEASSTSGTFEMQVKAREVSTDLIADEVRRDVGDVGPGETQVFPVTLDVPDGFNYEVEAVLWDGSFVVERGVDHVQLLPEKEVPEGRDIVVSDPDLRDFIGPDRGDAGRDSPDRDRATVPGFGAAGLLVAAAAAVAWTARRRNSA